MVKIIKKAKEGRLRWLGHVMRREPENEREKEPTKTKTEVEGCHSERDEAEQDRGWCMEGQEQAAEPTRSRTRNGRIVKE